VFAEPADEPHIGPTEFLTHSQDGPAGGVSAVGDVIGEGAGPADPVQHLSFQLVFFTGSGYPARWMQGGDPGGFQSGAKWIWPHWQNVVGRHWPVRHPRPKRSKRRAGHEYIIR